MDTKNPQLSAFTTRPIQKIYFNIFNTADAGGYKRVAGPRALPKVCILYTVQGVYIKYYLLTKQQ